MASYIVLLHREFLEVFAELGLIQWVAGATMLTSNNTRDLFFTSEHDRVGGVEISAPFPHCCHFSAICSYVFQFPSDHDSVRECTLWFRGSYVDISHFLSEID